MKKKAYEKNAKSYFFSKKYWIYYIILFGTILKLLSFIKRPDLWWDGASYVGIGKYIWTFGELGFWNPVRPLVLPLILGFFWKIGIDPIIFGRILQVLFAGLSVYLIYEIAKRIFDNENIALLSALLLAVDAIIYNNTQHLLTSTIAMAFSLLAVNLYLKSYDNKFDTKLLIYSGVFACFAFMSRLTFIFIGISIGLSLISTEKIKKIKEKILKTFYFSIAFFIVWLPYLILNFMLYKNPLYPYFRGIYEIGLAGTALHYPLTYYLQSFSKIAAVTLMSVAGIYFLFKNFKNDKFKFLLLLFFSGFLYHMFLVDVKVMRYAILFLPFLYIISSYGVVELAKKNKIIRTLMVFIVLVSISQSFLVGTNYNTAAGREDAYSITAFLRYGQNEGQNYLEHNYYNYLDKPEYYGATVLSSSPYPVAYSDIRMHSLFFPNVITLKEFEDKGQPFYVMISMSDNYCDPSLEFCQKQQAESNEAYDHILLNYKQVYNVSVWENNYFVFKSE